MERFRFLPLAEMVVYPALVVLSENAPYAKHIKEFMQMCSLVVRIEKKNSSSIRSSVPEPG